EMAERWLMRVYPRLRRLPPLPDAPAPGAAPANETPSSAPTAAASPVRRDRAFPTTAAERQRSVASATRWRAVYDEVRRRHAEGEPIMRISQTLGVAHGTVRRFARAAECPGRAPHRRQRSLLDPYLGHLLARHAAGCENAQALWREIRTLGYRGRPPQVRRWLQERRRQHAPTARHQHRRPLLATRQSGAAPLPSPTQLAWLLVRPPDQLPAADACIVRHLAQDDEAARVMALAQRFAALLRDRTGDVHVMRTAFDQWLDGALSCGVRAVETFARGLAQDGAAVRAALTTPWSNGQTEGQVTKLKLLKRQMYGRAKLDLLRRRLLLAA
ncbi:MAG TPA: transposase, partial [Gemmatirosa sp.]